MNNVHALPPNGKSPDYLHFRVASQMWRVSIFPAPLRENGKAAMTLRMAPTREILISPDVRPKKRLRILVTALRQAWDMSDFDYKNSGVDEAGLNTEIMSMHFAEDLGRNGGEQVLRFLNPPGKNNPPETAPRPKMPDVFPAGSERALKRWQELGRELASNPDLELDIETAAPLFATFAQLVNAGYFFDQTTSALMAVLKRQGFSHDGESDYDNRRMMERGIA